MLHEPERDFSDFSRWQEARPGTRSRKQWRKKILKIVKVNHTEKQKKPYISKAFFILFHWQYPYADYHPTPHYSFDLPAGLSG